MRKQNQTVLDDTLAVERPRYFPRQMITPQIMTMEQDYFRDRLRLHNRMLHGWGVVCGVLVAPIPVPGANGGVEAWKVRVCPGYVLGPHGDEIIVACEHEIDVRQTGVTGTAADPCGPQQDPWCSDIWMERDVGASYYIAVKYKEIAVRPQRVQPIGCGCDDSRCEASRWRDGYEIGVLTEAEYRQIKTVQEPDPPGWDKLFQDPNASNPVCWPAPKEPWVVLARVQLDDDGRPELIDNHTPRRLVAALGHFHWTCQTGVKIDSVDPDTLTQGDEGVDMTFEGAGFQEGLTLVLGKGISVVETPEVADDSMSITVTVNVADDAAPGERIIMVINPDCSYASSTLTVAEPEEEEAAPQSKKSTRRRAKAKGRDTSS